MKLEREHLVPPARQVVEQLQYLQSVTGYSQYVFPSGRDSGKPVVVQCEQENEVKLASEIFHQSKALPILITHPDNSCLFLNFLIF